mmetsp:Transcript_45646/g.105963  ORF Transcript_45646/g.105963 Transcript_45646/m.105963 type:complete len:348 (-) Transcript_45646:23-1066(-)
MAESDGVADTSLASTSNAAGDAAVAETVAAGATSASSSTASSGLASSSSAASSEPAAAVPAPAVTKASTEDEAEDAGDGLDLGGTFKELTGAVGGAMSGAQTFFRSNVLENEQLHSRVKDVGDSVKDTAAEWSETASGAWSSLRQKVTEKEVVTNVTGNVSKGWGWTMGAVGSLWEKAQDAVGEIIGDNEAQEEQEPERRPVRCPKGQELIAKPNSDGVCSYCGAKGTRYACSKGDCDFEVCTKCFDKGAPDDEEIEEDAADSKNVPDPMDPSSLDALAKELGMTLGGDAKEAAAETSDSTTSVKPATKSASAPMEPAIGGTGSVAAVAAAKPKPKPEDDFFAELGM